MLSNIWNAFALSRSGLSFDGIAQDSGYICQNKLHRHGDERKGLRHRPPLCIAPRCRSKPDGNFPEMAAFCEMIECAADILDIEDAIDGWSQALLPEHAHQR